MHVKTRGRLAGLVALLVGSFAGGTGTSGIAAPPQSTTSAPVAAQPVVQETLSGFLSYLKKTEESDLENGAKIAVPSGDGSVEALWVTEISATADGYLGTIAESHQPSAKVHFTRGMILDWYVARGDGRLYGAFTTRVMLDHMLPDSARQARAILAPQPLPPHW